MIVFGYCTKCDNKGYRKVMTEPIPRSGETDRQAGLRMVEGGVWYKTEKVPCPDLDKPEHK